MITHPQLVAALAKPGDVLLSSLTPSKVNLWHAATGISGEGGELLEGLRAKVSYDEQRTNLIEESGDLYFYIEQLVQETGMEIPWNDITADAYSMRIGQDMMLSYGIEVAVCSAQVLDTVKKCTIYNKELNQTVLSIQLYDLLKYLMALGLMFGFGREVAISANIAKLSKRYEGLKYSDKAAQDRADKS